jgi:hypothetical protein
MVSMLRGCCVAGLAAFLLLSVTCSLRLKSVNPSSAVSPLQSIEAGVTTRMHLETMLGLPAASFEGGRVAVWNLDKKQKPGVLAVDDVRFQLIAVFDERKIVERYSLLRIR